MKMKENAINAIELCAFFFVITYFKSSIEVVESNIYFCYQHSHPTLSYFLFERYDKFSKSLVANLYNNESMVLVSCSRDKSVRYYEIRTSHSTCLVTHLDIHLFIKVCLSWVLKYTFHSKPMWSSAK